MYSYVKRRAYSVFKVEGIILPTDLKGNFLKKRKSVYYFRKFYEALWSSRVFKYASLKMLISRLLSAVYNLIP